MVRKDIKTRKLADGTQLSIPVFYFPGIEAKSVYIQSGIHGSEVQSYLVALLLIRHFLKYPPKCNITIVPIANPYGLNNKIGEYTFGRFDPVTGNNWNRNYVDLSDIADAFFRKRKNVSFEEMITLFKQALHENIEQRLNQSSSYHKKIALQLQSLAVSADVVLDLHCDTISMQHLYCPSYAMQSALHFGMQFIIEIPHTFNGALDEASFCPWIALTEIYNRYHKTEIKPPIEAFTVELGNHEKINSEKAERQASHILNYLKDKGLVEYNNEIIYKQPVYSCKLENFITLYADSGGLIVYCATLGNELPAKESLLSLSIPFSGSNCCTDDVFTYKHICYNTEAIPIACSPSAVVHEGTELMKIMTQYRQVCR